MKVVDRLNALDRRVLPKPTARAWVRTASMWWSSFVIAGLWAGFALDSHLQFTALIFGLGSGFSAGFWYREHLRLQRKVSRWAWFRRPDGVD